METIDTIETVETTTLRILVSKLVISPLNVRKKQGTGIEELAALIASQGLIHNLVVTEQKKGKKSGKYEVVAGGRRLAALNLLIADGRLPKNHEVECRVVGHEEALELSLSENSGREHMHPADLVMAYRSLTDAGFSPDEIAPRFGVSPLTVKRYLKLTSVSPRIFALYAEDKMNFEQISALALTDDHELQERIWSNIPDWQRTGHAIRRLITETEIEIRNSPVALFVGVPAYEEAGGLIRRDLFGAEDDGYMQDAELLQRLALAKLEQEAGKLREEGFAWVECRTETVGYSDLCDFGRVQMLEREVTAEEQKEIEALENTLQSLLDEQNALSDAKGDEEALDQRYNALEDEITKTQEALESKLKALEFPDPEQMAVAGAIVFVTQEGTLKVERGLVRREDLRKLANLCKQDHASKLPESDSETSVPAVETKPVHSEKLTRMLTAERTAAIQAAMVHRPEVALAAVTSRLAQTVFSSYRGRSDRIVQINLERSRLHDDAPKIGNGRAMGVFDERFALWASRIETVATCDRDLFGWLLQQPQEEVLDLLALCVSSSVDTVSGRENAIPSNVSRLMNALDMDMADWWEPTGESYLSHVSKDRILGIVSEAVSPQIAQTLTGFKKAELVAAAEKHLFGVRWLPDSLKTVQG